MISLDYFYDSQTPITLDIAFNTNQIHLTLEEAIDLKNELEVIIEKAKEGQKQ